MIFTGCASDDPNFNPNTDTEVTQTITFEGDYWNALIDAPQYNGLCCMVLMPRTIVGAMQQPSFLVV